MAKRCCIFLSAFLLFFSFYNAQAEVDIGNFGTDGFIEGYFFPPHNEYDPNPTIPFAVRNVARYALEFHLKVWDKKHLPKLFFFMDSFSAFGDSHPQTDYNYAADPIVMIQTMGLGYQTGKHWQVRLTTSRHIDLGGYQVGERLIWSSLSVRYGW